MTATNKLLHIFWETDMRCSHEGLKAVAKKKRFPLSDMKQGDCVVFVNRQLTRVKMFASGTKCMLYIAEGNKRIEPDTIRLLPGYIVGGAELDYLGALQESINQRLAKRARKRKAKG